MSTNLPPNKLYRQENQWTWIAYIILMEKIQKCDIFRCKELNVYKMLCFSSLCERRKSVSSSWESPENTLVCTQSTSWTRWRIASVDNWQSGQWTFELRRKVTEGQEATVNCVVWPKRKRRQRSMGILNLVQQGLKPFFKLSTNVYS